MKIYLCGHDYKYHVCQTINLFYKRPKLHYVLTQDQAEISSTLSVYDGKITATAFVTNSEYTYRLSVPFCEADYEKLSVRLIKTALYMALRAALHVTLPWGSLTGIRPCKMARTMLEDGRPLQEISDMYRTQFDVTEEKINLAIETAQTEMKCLKNMRSNGISLYIGIPFCPSRCVYCSFYSAALKQDRAPLINYLEALTLEMEAAQRIIRTLGLCIEAVYIGGGTPTVLNEIELAGLLAQISKIFDLTYIREFCVEAGRPDTITWEKLSVLKQFGVGRLSINPQSMHNDTLEMIGRNHSKTDILRAFQLAREAGISTINCDLIAGLPGEDVSKFCSSVKQVLDLSPENVTVHTMSMKRASQLVEENHSLALYHEDEVTQMVSSARQMLQKSGYQPYYLYRQKNMLASQENVGYAKPGTESLYNIYIMEEVQTVIALGAGASTKIVTNNGKPIERIFNVKTAEEYTRRIGEMIERKQQILNYYKD